MRFRALATVAATVVAGLTFAVPASAQLELKVSSPYVVYPGAVTVKVRSTAVGAIEFRQERRDRRSVGPGGLGPGWSCVTPASASKPGFIEGYRVVERVEYPVAGAWVAFKIRASRLDYFSSFQQQLIALTQGPEYTRGACLDPATQFTRFQAYQPSAFAPVGVSLTRLL